MEKIMNTGEDGTKQGTDAWKHFMELYRIDIGWIRAFLCANFALSALTLIAIITKVL